MPDYLPHLIAAGVAIRDDRVVVASPGFLASRAGPGPARDEPQRTGWNPHESGAWSSTKPFGEPVVVRE